RPGHGWEGHLCRDVQQSHVSCFAPGLRGCSQGFGTRFLRRSEAADIFSSTLYQAVLTDFILEGHFARHIRRMRMLYMERRRALVNAIQMQMGDVTEVIGAEAGMHLVVLLPRGTDDVAVSRKAAQKGISAVPLSTCYLRP